MSQVDELYESLSPEQIAAASVDSETEPHIIIGKDRKVTVPDSLKRIAVEGDHDIETVRFDCPRFWDEHDMSKMIIRINYMRPDGYKDSYVAYNVVVDDADTTIMHFDWTISKNVTLVKGNLSFLVCAEKTDSAGNEERHWHSELCTDMYISEGLECSESVMSEYPDLVTHLLTHMNEPITPEKLDRPYWEYSNQTTVNTYADLDVIFDGENTNETIYSIKFTGLSPIKSIVGDGEFIGYISVDHDTLLLINKTNGDIWTYTKGSSEIIKKEVSTDVSVDQDFIYVKENITTATYLFEYGFENGKTYRLDVTKSIYWKPTGYDKSVLMHPGGYIGRCYYDGPHATDSTILELFPCNHVGYIWYINLDEHSCSVSDLVTDKYDSSSTIPINGVGVAKAMAGIEYDFIYAGEFTDEDSLFEYGFEVGKTYKIDILNDLSIYDDSGSRSWVYEGMYFGICHTGYLVLIPYSLSSNVINVGGLNRYEIYFDTHKVSCEDLVIDTYQYNAYNDNPTQHKPISTIGVSKALKTIYKDLSDQRRSDGYVNEYFTDCETLFTALFLPNMIDGCTVYPARFNDFVIHPDCIIDTDTGVGLPGGEYRSLFSSPYINNHQALIYHKESGVFYKLHYYEDEDMNPYYDAYKAFPTYEEFTDVNERLGDIDTALDNIIAMQESLIGGGSE